MIFDESGTDTLVATDEAEVTKICLFGSTINRSLTPWIRQLLYALKRQYGSTIIIHSQGEATTDLKTGLKSVQETLVTVIRAPVLPAKILRVHDQTISQISANKAFVYGATYDLGTRQFIIDRRDVPVGFELDQDDWIEFKNKRYEIKEIGELEYDSAWTVVGEHSFGES